MFSQFHSSLIHASLYHGKVYFKVFFIVSKLIRDKIVLFTQRSILHIFEMLTKMLSSGSTDVKFNPPYIKHVCNSMKDNKIPNYNKLGMFRLGSRSFKCSIILCYVISNLLYSLFSYFCTYISTSEYSSCVIIHDGNAILHCKKKSAIFSLAAMHFHLCVDSNSNLK